MIKYRPQRGSLEDAMKESQVFDTVGEMFVHIATSSDGMLSVDDLSISSSDGPDKRIHWKESRSILTKRFGNAEYDVPQCIGYCSIKEGDAIKKLLYPAIFHPAEEGGFWITFPDFPECMTQGDNMDHAYKMAADALSFAIISREESKEEIPAASTPSILKLQNKEFYVLIEFDMLAYKKRTSSKSVKKTLSIPEWLNEEATARGINFSQVLQEALINKINQSGIDKR